MKTWMFFYGVPGIAESISGCILKAEDLNSAKTEFMKTFAGDVFVFYGMALAKFRPDGSIIWHPTSKQWLTAERDLIVNYGLPEEKTLQIHEQSLGTDTEIDKNKPMPQYPFEVHQDLEKFRNVDYMAAVRDSCKGQAGARTK